MRYGIVHTDGHHDGQGHGQHDAPQHAELRAAVQTGGFKQLFRQTFEESLGDDQVIHADHAGHEHGEHGIQQTRSLNDQVGRHGAGAEDHGEYNALHDELVAGHAVTAEGIGHQQGEEQVADGADNCQAHGDPQTVKERAVLEHFMISGQGELGGDQHEAAALYQFRIGGKGHGDNIQNRDQAYQQDDDHDRIDNDVECDVVF